jgi:WD40 repeat protein
MRFRDRTRRAYAATLALAVAVGGLSASEPLILRHHSGWVGGVAFSEDSRFLATGSADRTIHVMDLTKKQPDKVLRGHKDHVSALAFAPQGCLLASAGYDHTARLFNIESNASVVLKGHQGVVTSVAFSLDGKWLATGSIDARAIIWDVATGERVQVLTGHRSWVNAVAFNRAGDLATASSDNTVRLWRQKDKTWTEAAHFEFPEGEVRSLAFAPNGKILAAGVRYGFLKVIDLRPKKAKVITRKGHAADVWAVAFAPDGKTLATGDGDWDRPGDIRLWDTSTWKEQKSFKTSGEVLCLTFSPAGHHLAAGCWDKTVHLWPLAAEKSK